MSAGLKPRSQVCTCRSPMIRIHTVAAGGGSILHYEGGRFRVGPESAGSNPGPACYRKGRPLTVTDCNVMLGKLQPEFFPKLFGLNADQSLDSELVRRKFSELSKEVSSDSGFRTPEQVAEGFFSVAVENMTNAIKKVSVQQGYNIKNIPFAALEELLHSMLAGLQTVLGLKVSSFIRFCRCSFSIRNRTCRSEAYKRAVHRG